CRAYSPLPVSHRTGPVGASPTFEYVDCARTSLARNCCEYTCFALIAVRGSVSRKARLNEAAGAAVKGRSQSPPVSEDHGFFAAEPFRQEVFRWPRSSLFAAA